MYRKLSEQEKADVVEMLRRTESALITGAAFDIDPAEVMAINFFWHSRPQPPEPSPAREQRAVVELKPARKGA